jgi:hypothetical protein
VSRAQAFRWHKLSEGKALVEDEQHSRQPSTTRTGDNTAQVRELVWSDGRLTAKMIADEVNMNQETTHLILIEELGRNEKNLCQDGEQESHRATVGYTVECLC